MRLLTLLCLLTLVACMSPAPRDAPLTADDAGSAAPPATTPLPDAVLRQVAADPEARAFVRRIHDIETRLTGRALVAGNDARLLIDGPEAHRVQLAAIAEARHHVHLISYIITDDAIGQKYRDALVARAAAGVKVRIMFDTIGSRGAGPEFRESLRRGGVELHAYAPKRQFWRVSQRNHRKLLIVDGRVAFTGGISISDDYRKSAGIAIGASQGSEQGWRDTHVRIEGPAVEQFQRLFMAQWRREAGPIPDDPGYLPTVRPAGAELVRMLANNGDDLPATLRDAAGGPADRDGERPGENEIYGSYIGAIRQSARRVWITQAYFAPNGEFLETLQDAARRLVDVRLIVPGNSDVGLLLHASRRYYQRLLEAGVRIFEYQGPVMHAKTAVIDSVWTTIGSSNLDYRSFIHNDEVNAVIVGARFARIMERMFEDDLGQALEIKLPEWQRRPALQKLRERLAVLLKYWI